MTHGVHLGKMVKEIRLVIRLLISHLQRASCLNDPIKPEMFMNEGVPVSTKSAPLIQPNV